MATTYDASTFDTGVLPGGLHRDAQELALGAVAFGWKVQVKGMFARLISPDGSKVIALSASDKNIPYERHKKTIHRHANPLLLAAVESDEGLKSHAANIVDAGNEARRKREAAEAQVEQARIEDGVSVRKPEPEVEAETPQPSVLDTPDLEGERFVVSEGPMMAHASQGKGYISPTTNERVWSDGVIDYTCRSKGCEFSSEERRGVGPHWRKHVLAGTEKPAASDTHQTYVTPPHEPVYQKGYTPRRERVSGLAAVLAALDLTSMTPEELAEFVLNWQHVQSETGSRMAAEREELTSDDVLNRIRSLLDNGTYLKQQEQIADLRTETDSLGAALDEAVKRAQQAEERWTTLRELISMDETVDA